MDNFYFINCIFMKYLNFILELCLSIHLFVQKFNEILYVLGTQDTVVSKVRYCLFPHGLL